ncbi:MAG: zf-TFIIB domain-containing protein [Nanobdellota archaeon]
MRILDKNKKNKKTSAKIDKKTGEKILKCPRDEKEMDKIVKNNVVLDICPKCGGMWIDKGEINKLNEVRKKNE